MANVMSDGQSDGIALMYVKNGTVYPVALNKEQVEMLNITLSMALGGRLTVVEDKPQGELVDYKKEKAV